MKHLLRYLSRYKTRMTLGLTIKVLGTLMDLVLPYILAHLIDDVVPTGNVRTIVFWGATMLVCAGLGFSENVIGNRIASAVARDTSRALRHDLFLRVTTLSSRQIDGITVPSLESRLTSDTYNVHQMVGMMQRLGVRAPILLIGGLIVTFMTEPVLTLVIAAVLPLIILTVWLVTKRSIPVYEDVQKANDGMVRVVRENAQGVRIIKALSRSEHEKERFRAVNAHLSERENTAGTITSFSSPLMTLFLYLGQTGVIIVGALRVASGLTQPGKIIAFLSYFTMILNAMLSVTRMFVIFSKGSASADRIGEILDVPQDLLPIAPTGETSDAFIEFRDVSFSYLGVKNNVEHISFRLEKGQSLGIIGATGSGKSTLILLLMRFYDVGSGSVFLEGKDIREYGRDELLSRFGSVFQNDMVFGETISGNIDLWRDLPEEAIRKAAQTAQAENFILSKPGQYKMEVQSAGTNLSGGQRQRLLIARALAAKPQILLFDDSSSALDFKTDADLNQAIREQLPADTTRITVTQRVSSIMDCDLILVLEGGKIIGQGNHASLLRDCDVYREISESQMGGVILDE